VIVAGARTPFGKFGGVFKDLPAVTLGAHAIRSALERSGVGAEQVDYVIMGQVLQAGAGQITARQAAIGDGGAVALGHPIGASGARLVLTVAHELKRRGLHTGAATLCGGGGQGDALIVRRPQ
jgi:acetyl-CoA C-acetyltransferase